MTEILKGALGGAWTWLIAFVFPAALFWCALGLAFKLEDPDPSVVTTWMHWSTDSRLLIAGFGAAGLGLLLLAVNNALLRLLEGYVGRRIFSRLWETLRARQLRRKEAVATALAASKKAGEAASLGTGFLIEQLMHYPTDDAQVAPTRFGNAIRSFETYGASTFGLDSQLLWNELRACAPESARAEEDDARAYVDMLANLTVLSAFLAMIALARMLWRWELDSAWPIVFLGGVLVAPLWYALAVQACFQWAGTVRALVNLGRKDLAAQLGLTIPAKLADETDMWHQVVWLIREGPDPMDPISKYRETARTATSKTSSFQPR